MTDVLIVEDESGLRGTLEEVLRGAGHTVETAGGGAEALALSRRFAPELLISDWALGTPPDGLELIDQMRTQRPGLKVILMTAYSSTGLKAWADANRSCGLLEKPFSLSDFRALVARILDGAT